MVSGSMRVPSPLLNQPLKSPHHTRFDSSMSQRLRVRLGPAPLPALDHQPGTLHNLPHRAGCRPTAPWLVPLQNPMQLAWSPRHVRLAQSQHRRLDGNRGLVGMTLRCPVQCHQSFRPALPVTTQPNIARLSADPKPLAQSPYRLLIAHILKHKAQLLFHHTARSPAHLDDLFDYCFPILDKIGHKLDSLEDDVFEGRSEEVVRDISNAKQEIISYRKIVKPERSTLRLLERHVE